MRNATTAGAIGGMAAGLLLIGVTRFDGGGGLLSQTTSETLKGWLGRTFSTHGRIGDNSAGCGQQAIHLATSISFGGMYGQLRGLMKRVPPVALGAIYGTILYAISAGAIEPETTVTKGRGRAATDGSLQKLGLHILFGVVTALATDALLEKPGKKA